MTTVPAEALVNALELHRQAFVSLKAIGTVEIAKRGKTRAFDTVGIVVDDQHRLRMEAYGPLGQSLLAVVWNGKDVLLRMPGEERIMQAGPSGLERILGRDTDPAELSATLSGNVPWPVEAEAAALRCADKGDYCILELQRGDRLVRARVTASSAEKDQEPRVLSYEVLKSGKLVFQASFDDVAFISHYRLPLRVVIIKPSEKLQLTVQYGDIEVNVPLADEVFSLSDEDEVETRK